MTFKHMSVLGPNWFQAFSLFRLDPISFFDKTKINRENLCLDMLRDICLDQVDVQSRMCLLRLLQEHSALLIKDLNLLEQVVGSLVNLLDSLKSSSLTTLFKSQILSTICTLLLASESEPRQLITDFNNLLLSIVFGASADPVLVSAACECLEEMETLFPNLFANEILKLQSSCEKHLSPAFQSYAVVMSLSMKNIMEADQRALSKMKPLLPSLVSFLLEMMPFMSFAASFRLMKNILVLIKDSQEISPMVFKLFVPNLMFSSALTHNHMALDLLDAFSGELFLPQDEQVLLQQLMQLSTHPCLPVMHRLLFMDWLKALHKKGVKIFQYFSILPFLPSPFDGPMTQEKKCVVSALSIPADQNISALTDFLQESISGLKKCSLLPGGSKAAVSLFRTVYAYHSVYPLKLLSSFLFKLVLEKLKTAQHLLQHTLSFLHAIEMDFPESDLPGKSLSHMLDHVLSLPLNQLLRSVDGCLLLLEKVVESGSGISKPWSILRLLQKLLTDLDLTKHNEWELANRILSVCLSIFKFQNIQLFYSDLAEVLALISSSVSDVDIKDQAKLYYCTLTMLSKLKMHSIFVNKTEKVTSPNHLTSFVPGVNPSLLISASVQVLPASCLKLSRCEMNSDASLIFDGTSNSDTVPSIASYKGLLNSSNCSMKIPFFIKNISRCTDNFDILYGVVITPTSFPTCKTISRISVPVFSSSTDKDTTVWLNMTPYNSYPVDIYFNVEFNCKNGVSYVCYPDGSSLEFKDFFFPLPVPSPIGQRDALPYRKRLYELLWEEFEACVGSKQPGFFKSVFCMKGGKEELSRIVDREWKNFIVSRPNDSSCWIAIFLPPHCHLLMKSAVRNEKPFITLKGDDASLLPWIVLYLQGLESSR